MPFPDGWPPRATSTVRSFRFFQAGATTADFADNAWLFSSAASANSPLPYVAPGSTLPVVVGPVAGGGRDLHDAHNGQAVPVAQFTPRFCRVYNDTAGPNVTIQVSYDGTNVHDEILAGEVHEYEDRHEGGISFRIKPTHGAAAFRVVAW